MTAFNPDSVKLMMVRLEKAKKNLKSSKEMLIQAENCEPSIQRTDLIERTKIMIARDEAEVDLFAVQASE